MNLYKYHNNPSVLVSDDEGTESFKMKRAEVERIQFRQLAADIKTGKKSFPFEIAPKSTEKELDWDEAMKYCASLGDGWRLPTIVELKLMYVTKTDDMQYNLNWCFYWSSTEINGDFASILEFTDGSQFCGNKIGSNYVRAIRDKS